MPHARFLATGQNQCAGMQKIRNILRSKNLPCAEYSTARVFLAILLLLPCQAEKEQEATEIEKPDKPHTVSPQVCARASPFDRLRVNGLVLI